MFSFTSAGFDQLKPLSEFRFAAAAAEWVARVEPRVESAVKAAAPVGTGPNAGALRDSIRVHVAASPGGIRLDVESGVKYAGYVVGGTRAHDIRPRRARVLYWNDGTSHFARLVHHPGTRPNRFAQRALDNIRPHLEAQFAAIVERQVRRGA